MLEQFGLIPTGATSASIGDVFGRLTVVAVGQIENTYRYYAVCKCECGSPLKRIRMDGLTSGAVVSCGCYQKEVTTTHGQTGSIHYDRWRNIMDRCCNPDSRAYPDYGGRGIRLHEPWHDLANFVRDLPDGYFAGAEIDRINNDGHYEPGNVRWATSAQNADNRRSGRPLTLGDRTQSMERWAEELGVSVATLHGRLKSGWSVEQTLTTPLLAVGKKVPNPGKTHWAGREIKRYPYEGERLTIAEISARCGLPAKLLRQRIDAYGWSVERATQTPT